MLFAKEKPVKKIPFGDSWVTLQHLSKGQKDEIKSMLTELYTKLKDLDQETIEKMQNGESTEIPDALKSVYREISQVQYFKVTQAIKSWSAEEEPTEENVKALDESVFDVLSAEVDKMNELAEVERKN